MLGDSCFEKSIIFALEQVISVCLLSIQRISLLLLKPFRCPSGLRLTPPAYPEWFLSLSLQWGSAAGCEATVFAMALPEVPVDFFNLIRFRHGLRAEVL